ncbi:Protein of unknown function DUF3506 [Ostreococcus tauri]|uniref:Uncharacterized protein n=1 Tax=Ostreococcus tauri TaxID=70448 RepID=A0A096P9U8_OSTTA|nr:Protein of unknown function DUF3506 [Ostreococcus tauri]CEG00751.1 Protein of unknown function DUF3506 [Ostreococcus tauri]|eukprot:XP_003084183.2 Protein of unknown function DUF3506 [Ostreococcus tauri]
MPCVVPAPARATLGARARAPRTTRARMPSRARAERRRARARAVGPRDDADRSRDEWEREKKIPTVDVRRDQGKGKSARGEIEISKPDGARVEDQIGIDDDALENGTDAEIAGDEGVKGLNNISSSDHGECVSDPLASAAEAATARLRARLNRVAADASGTASADADTASMKELTRRFYEIECEASALQAIEAQMEDAVAEEDFASAASLKRAADALRATDETGKLCDRYADAIKNERFEEAVALRDAGVGMCGWWAGVEERSTQGEDDEEPTTAATGVIMRISREHGRLVGATYSPRDLADIVELNKAYPEGYDYEAGQPVMEIIVREDASSPTGYSRDVVRLNYVPMSIPLVDEEEDALTDGVGFMTASAGTSEALGAIEQAERLRSRENIDDVKEEIKAKLLGLDPASGKPRDEILEEVGAMLDKFDDVMSAEENDDEDEETLYDVTRSVAALNPEGLHAFILTSDSEMVPLGEGAADEEEPFSKTLDEEMEGFLAAKWESMATSDSSDAKSGALGASSHAALVSAVKEAAQEMFAHHDQDDEDDGEKYFDDGEDDVDEMSAEELLALIGQDDILHRPLPNRVRFQRIDPSLASGSRKDIFDRLYIGAFGPHGPEVLRLVRGRWGDEDGDSNDCVTAVKLTGDENVPCGAASFRAKVNKSNLITEGGSYPDDLGVIARYKGEGRVAKPGFTESHWVEGELLVLNGRGGSLTGGAELGFVWAVPGERRLLILFSALALPEVEIIPEPR